MGNVTGHLNTGQHAHVRACTQTGRSTRFFQHTTDRAWNPGASRPPVFTSLGVAKMKCKQNQDRKKTKKKNAAFSRLGDRRDSSSAILSAGVWKLGLWVPGSAPAPGPGASRQLHSRPETSPPLQKWQSLSLWAIHISNRRERSFSRQTNKSEAKA